MLKSPKARLGPLLGMLFLLTAPANVWAACGDAGVALQILGSGGPFGTGSASSGYLLWIDGVSRIMVDAGGGTLARFHEADAKVSDLQLLALSHHTPAIRVSVELTSRAVWSISCHATAVR